MNCHAGTNPFAAQRFHALDYCGGDNFAWDNLLERLWAQGGRGALLGPHGHGKTTLLRGLKACLENSGERCLWLGLNRDTRRIRPDFWEEFRPGCIVLLDGAEQLPAWEWRRFLWRTRAARGVIITTHTPGRLPLLHRCTTDEKLLRKLLQKLTEHESAALESEALRLYHAHKGNLREVWFGLYEHCAQ